MFRSVLLLGTLIALLGIAKPALCHDWEPGWWRIESTLATGVESGITSRSGDTMFLFTVEYEQPVLSRIALNARILPVFIYDQENSESTVVDDQGEESIVRNKGKTAYGGGLGIGGRWYPFSDNFDGLFFGINGHMFGHKHRIKGNTKSINVLTGGEIGYRFNNNWHLAFRYDHISNAGLGRSNQSANTAGLGVGFSF